MKILFLDCRDLCQTLPRVLLFPVAEKVNKKATAEPDAIKVRNLANFLPPASVKAEFSRTKMYCFGLIRSK